MEIHVEQQKKISNSDQKLLDSLQLGKSPEVVRNPLSGVEVLLPPRGVALYKYIMDYYDRILRGKTSNIRDFDRARYLFLKLFPDAYMDLLD